MERKGEGESKGITRKLGGTELPVAREGRTWRGWTPLASEGRDRGEGCDMREGSDQLGSNVAAYVLDVPLCLCCTVWDCRTWDTGGRGAIRIWPGAEAYLRQDPVMWNSLHRTARDSARTGIPAPWSSSQEPAPTCPLPTQANPPRHPHPLPPAQPHTDRVRLCIRSTGLALPICGCAAALQRTGTWMRCERERGRDGERESRLRRLHKSLA